MTQTLRSPQDQAGAGGISTGKPVQGLFTQPFAVSYQDVGDYLLTWFSLDPHTVFTCSGRTTVLSVNRGTFICPFLPNLHAFMSFSCLTALGRTFIMVLKKENSKAFEVLTTNCSAVAKFSVTLFWEV